MQTILIKLFHFSTLRIFIPIFLMALSFNSHAVVYYVSKTGKDINKGSLTSPFLTIKKGISILKPGDTLFIRAGTWTEQIDLAGPNKSGTASAWLKISGYPGETVVIKHTTTSPSGYGPIKARGNRGYIIFENLILDGTNESLGTSWQIREGNHHFTLRNVEMRNFKSSALHIKGNYIQVINCKFHHSKPPSGSTSRLYGIYLAYGDNVVLEGNHVHNNSGGGIHAFPGPIRNAVIKGNRVYDNNTVSPSSVPGILVFADIDYYNGTAIIDGVQVYNNIVYGNGAGGIFASNGTKNVKIWNNTVYANKGWGINVQFGSNGKPINTTVQNNIVYANTVGQIVDTGINTIKDRNVIVNPKFVNALAKDFRLTSSSPAVNKGAAISSVRTDIVGTARPKGGYYDIGAYESY